MNSPNFKINEAMFLSHFTHFNFNFNSLQRKLSEENEYCTFDKLSFYIAVICLISIVNTTDFCFHSQLFKLTALHFICKI